MAITETYSKYSNMTLDELAILAGNGDDRAIELVYERSQGMLRSKANLYFMIGADRGDVIQEGMIGLFSAIRTFDPKAGASFKTFAELCVKRHIINAVKLAGRKKHLPLNESVSIDTAADDNEMGEAFMAPQATNPEEIVLLADLMGFVESNSKTLFSGLEQEVWRAYSRGENVEKITKKLGRSKKTVDNTLTRIKRKIEKLISLY